MKSFGLLFLIIVIAAQAQAFLVGTVVGIITAKAQANLFSSALSYLTAQEKDELSLAQKAITYAARTRCRWTESLTQEEEDEIRANKFDNLSRKQQCFIKCVSDTFRFADVAVDLLSIDQTPFNKILDPLVEEDDAAVISAKCDDLKGADQCETAAIKYKCYADLDATHLI